MNKQKKIYFASDNHLGMPNLKESISREKIFTRWLENIRKDAQAIFILGDLFDFWFEYNSVVPKGFTRVLGKIAEISDSGIPIYFFVGNHDLWMKDYFEKELNVKVFFEPISFQCNQKRFFVGHGDGLGPGDNGYKIMKKIFTNPVCKFLFRWLHPDIGVRLAQHMSVNNKIISGKEDVLFLGEDKEMLIQYCKNKLKAEHYDFFVFGHRHLPMVYELEHNSKYINTGDWIDYFTFVVYDKQGIRIEKYENFLDK